MRRSRHNLSHHNLLTGDMGHLYPIGLVEALPGDTFQHSTSALVRLSPLAAPVMHPISVRIHHFFVPHRLYWPTETHGTWEDFITGGPDNDNAFNVPTMETTGGAHDLLDYLGMPRVAGVNISQLPVRAFNGIFNEFYRDQDLEPERALTSLTVPEIAWEKDYFTSARPWAQKGEDITIPLSGTAPLEGLAEALSSGDPAGQAHNVVADLSAGALSQVSDLRRAFALQRFAEARLRYGSRYTEYLRYLGITPSDARLDRPEYLGGGRVRVSISEVLQTGPELAGEQEREFGVGDLYGHGIAAMRSNAYRRFFQEHGYVVSCLSVRPKSIYSAGIHRTWLRRFREDFWQKELQYIGQQPIEENEIFADPISGTGTWGYQDRYREYREQPSIVCGDYRDNLNYWHMGRIFNSLPALNANFIRCDATKRIHNDQNSQALWMAVQHSIVARRLVGRAAAPRLF